MVEHRTPRSPVKLPVYRQIPSVQEIVLLDSDGLYAEVHRRSGLQWITELLYGPEAVLALQSVGTEIRLGDLYEGIALPDVGG
jgi:Uma2 family endonuclease